MILINNKSNKITNSIYIIKKIQCLFWIYLYWCNDNVNSDCIYHDFLYLPDFYVYSDI